MLVLTRKTGQAIRIGDDVVVRVTEVKGRGDKALVKIGIEAPSKLKILREEVEQEIAEEMALAKDPTFELFHLKDGKSKTEDPPA